MGSLSGLTPARRNYLMGKYRERQRAADARDNDKAKAAATTYYDPAANPAALLPDSQYTMETGRNRSQYDTAINDFTGRENRLGSDYGIDFTRGADGSLASYNINENVDLTNPFSQAALLKRAFTQRSQGTQNSYAAQGQLYSGALQSAQTDNAFGFQQGQDSLFKQFRDNFLGIGADRAAAANALSGADLDARAGLLDRRTAEAPVDPGPAPAQSQPASVTHPAALDPAMVARVKARLLAEAAMKNRVKARMLAERKR